MRKLCTVLFIFCVLLILSCVNKTPLSPENKNFAGKWITNDGTWIHVYNDGGGSFELSNSSVSGGAATLTDSTLEIGLFGIDSKFDIDKAPYEENGVWKMELDGILYVKQKM